MKKLFLIFGLMITTAMTSFADQLDNKKIESLLEQCGTSRLQILHSLVDTSKPTLLNYMRSSQTLVFKDAKYCQMALELITIEKVVNGNLTQNDTVSIAVKGYLGTGQLLAAIVDHDQDGVPDEPPFARDSFGFCSTEVFSDSDAETIAQGIFLILSSEGPDRDVTDLYLPLEQAATGLNVSINDLLLDLKLLPQRQKVIRTLLNAHLINGIPCP